MVSMHAFSSLGFSGQKQGYTNTIANPKAFLTTVTDSFKAHYNRPYRGSTEPTPYAAHTLGTAALVLQMYGTETEAMAANLHDVLEKDTEKLFPKAVTQAEKLSAIAKRFSPQVAKIVLETTSSPGRGMGAVAQKSLFIANNPHLSTEGGRLVKLADLVNNLEGLNASIRANGLDKTFQGFRGNDAKDPILTSYQDYLTYISLFLTLEKITPNNYVGLTQALSGGDDTNIRRQYRLALLERFVQESSKFHFNVVSSPSQDWQPSQKKIEAIGPPAPLFLKHNSLKSLLSNKALAIPSSARVENPEWAKEYSALLATIA